MLYIGALISLQFIILTVYWLSKRYNPQGVLLLSGILMLFTAAIVGIPHTATTVSTGSAFFDVFKAIGDSFSMNVMHGGLMIITIGGYVVYMKKIKASDALVEVSMQPLALLHRYPYLAACSIIPIGQILFICIPSATGLDLLLVATVLPVLLKIGVSRLTAVSVITACTVFDIGPGSANTLEAAELAGVNKLHYFLDYQLGVVVPMTLFLMVMYYLTSRYFDRRDRTQAPSNGLETEHTQSTSLTTEQEEGSGVPHIYALLPILPLLLLLIFSNYTNLFSGSVNLDITSATLLSLLIAMAFDLVRYRSLGAMFHSLKTFWNGMGKTFSGVITLIVCAEIFSKGLIGLGFVDALVDVTMNIGLSGITIGVMMTLLIFLVAMLMGSGNASFFSFGPLVPDIAARIGVTPISMMLPMQMSAGLGRSVSPIASVIIAVSDIAGVSAFDVMKRNLIPVVSTLIFMLIYNYVFLI
ncbi:MAG: C4-dicarboxylate transporter DcuC [Alistipes sp.]